MKHRFTQEVPECSLEFSDQSRVNVVLSIVSFGSRSDSWEFAFPRQRSRRHARSRKLLILKAHLSKLNNMLNIDSRRHCKPIFAPTDKPSDNCVLAIPILNRAVNFISSFAERRTR